MPSRCVSPDRAWDADCVLRVPCSFGTPKERDALGSWKIPVRGSRCSKYPGDTRDAKGSQASQEVRVCSGTHKRESLMSPGNRKR